MIRLLTTIAIVSAAACGEPANTPAPVSPTTPATPASPVTPVTPKSATADVKAPGDAKIGDTARCPISGEEFVVTADSPHVEYEGKTYYTCCAGCKKKLESDPAKYLKANKT